MLAGNGIVPLQQRPNKSLYFLLSEQNAKFCPVMFRQFSLAVYVLPFINIVLIYPFYRYIRNLPLNIYVQYHCFCRSFNHRSKHNTQLAIFRYSNAKPRLTYFVSEKLIIRNDKSRLIIRLLIRRFIKPELVKAICETDHPQGKIYFRI